ncbi:MAG: insulinase family protein [Oleiphilaceae bacterium]|nr:insulinase family protein [Oleiphilaceae bacterium]
MKTLMSITKIPVRHGLLVVLLLLSGLARAEIEPIKSPNDDNLYRYLTLDNGLEVLLISDPDSDKAAASLDVAVGSGDDPSDREGLAHFLEHMLFLGTEKYPDPGEYQQYINSHGGSHNAFTAFQDTNYFFDIEAEFLKPALDRFAQQFAAPLFTKALVERERRAVHSEFSASLKDDGRRIHSARKAVANPDHAFSQFAVGNLTTLEDTESNPLRPDLLQFWEENYSANIMALVVYGPQTLDELEAMVKPRFGEIENRKLEPAAHTKPFFSPSTLPKRLEVEALKDLRKLSLTFPIPSMREHYLSKPERYVASLLGHEGPGSLFDVLRKAGLVESLSAGTGTDTGHHSTLELSMTLTQEGLDEQDKIIALAFDHIQKVRNEGIDERRFEEMQTLAEIDFRFRERPSPVQLVTQLSMQMHQVAPKDVLRAPWVMEKYAPDLYGKLLDRLKPENTLITVVSPELSSKKTEQTQWYETVYRVSDSQPKTLTQPALPELTDQLALPGPNPFIPEDLAMVTGETMAHPVQFSDSEIKAMPIWYARDTSFDTPRANLFVGLRSPATLESARNHVLTRLLVDAINTNLNAYAYPAREAGLSYDVYPHMRGVTVRVGGYSDKLATLLSRILDEVAEPKIDRQRFEIARQNVIDGLRNEAKERPVRQASQFLQSALIEGSWTTDEKLEAAQAVTLEDLRAFASQFLSKLDPVMLAHGNLTEASALNISERVKANLLNGSETVTVTRNKVRQLPGRETEVELQVDHPDTGYLLYAQGNNTDYSTRAEYRLLAQLISSPFYEEIRTNQQLGYVVYATAYEMLETPALGFIVQSPVADGDKINQAVAAFATEFESDLADLSDARLSRQKQAVNSKILEKDRELSEVSQRYWQEIDRSNANFDTREQLAKAVSETSLEALRETYGSAVLNRNRVLEIITVPGPTTSDAIMETLRKRPSVD